MKTIKKILFWTLPNIFIFAANARDNIIFDYSTMSFSSIGIYNPKNDGEKTGLNAELIARKNGIDNLEKYFESSCDGLDKASLDIKSDWENNFRSQGTEIYSNGVLAVTLKAQIKQIFKISLKSKKNLRTDDGEKIVFQLPAQIPINAIRCGTIEVNINNNKIHAIPYDSTTSNAPYIKIIHLVYNKNISALELDPTTIAADTDILENSNFVDIEDISSEILPILVSVNSSNE